MLRSSSFAVIMESGDLGETVGTFGVKQEGGGEGVKLIYETKKPKSTLLAEGKGLFTKRDEYPPIPGEALRSPSTMATSASMALAPASSFSVSGGI